MQDITMTEYERTFLAKTVPAEIHSTLPKRIVDTYLPDEAFSSDHPVLRLRRSGEQYEITKKTPISDDHSIQTEQTIPLSLEEFESLWAGHSRRVEKDRYHVTINGHEADVDIFSGTLNGLVLIDFEFSRESDKNAFTPPECCLAEVTQEGFVNGGQLAGKTYADIEADLKRFEYQPLSA